MGSLDQLLEKSARCQLNLKGNDLDDSDQEQDDSEDEDEDLDHDEIILGNTTDVLISVSKAFGDAFISKFTTVAPKLNKYLSPEHPKSDKIMIIGCIAEILNNCPNVIDPFYDAFFNVMMNHSNTTDGQMNRNCSYGIGILASKAPHKFIKHLPLALECIQKMHRLSDAQDAKDNCVATLIRILD